MKRIIVETIESQDQRYPTCGDYWETEDEMHFRITKQDNEDYEALVFLHEFVEFILTRKRGIAEPAISEYDIKWEEYNEKGMAAADEPGNEPGCIYYQEHRFSENMERLLAQEMNIDWFTYNNKLKI